MNEILRKMHIKTGSTVRLMGETHLLPDAFAQSDVVFIEDGRADAVIAIMASKADFECHIDDIVNASGQGMIWLCYPKSKGKVKYDIHRDILFQMAQERSLTVVANVAYSDDWSMLRIKKVIS